MIIDEIARSCFKHGMDWHAEITKGGVRPQIDEERRVQEAIDEAYKMIKEGDRSSAIPTDGNLVVEVD